MKNGQYIFYVMLNLFFASCEDGFDLARDNPNDQQYDDGGNPIETRELEFFSQNVACKLEMGETDYSTENVVRPGDRIWLNVVLRNASNLSVLGIRGEISSTSNSVTLEPVFPGYYIKFTDSSIADDQIDPFHTGWGVLTNGQYFRSAPNYYSYGVEFLVSPTANAGESVVFSLAVHDNLGNIWNDTFTIAIQ